ncbi:MAG: hypothetical protein EZS28_026654 [Streblomastix strix]|uniref:Uncharacterized protein n=1 Tax=Streblomastix strix TaxID=222440 RepID=A0A5J4V4V1_9EUKA|nr:MAG: hypothetical protein EZS28_026654 [Streblomastix strix]
MSEDDMVVRNIKPVPRDVQRTTKDYTEKSRLEGRVESYYHQPTVADIITPDPSNKLAFLKESERFRTDFASEYKEQKQNQRQEEERIRQIKLERQIDRENKHWEDVLQRQDKEVKSAMTHVTKKNDSGASYDPVTLEYRDTLDGDRLRFYDEGKEFRKEVRKLHLYKNINPNGYNPINGEPLQYSDMPIPDKPHPSQRLEEAQQQGRIKR